MPDAANPRTNGIALLADLAELGARVTEAMATAVRNPEVLTNATTQVLILLRTHGPSRPSELARHLGVSRPQITKLVGQLEEHEIVKRRHDIQSDRRAVTVSLTAVGDGILDAADQLLQQGFGDLTAVQEVVAEFLVRTGP